MEAHSHKVPRARRVCHVGARCQIEYAGETVISYLSISRVNSTLRLGLVVLVVFTGCAWVYIQRSAYIMYKFLLDNALLLKTKGNHPVWKRQGTKHVCCWQVILFVFFLSSER